MPENSPPQLPTPGPDGSNIYSYLAALVVVAGVVLTLLNMVDIWKALLGVVSIVLLLLVVGAFQLQNDGRISEKSFMELMLVVLRKIPPLGWFGKK